MRAALVLCLALGGCGARLGGPPLLSGQSPAAAEAAGSEPQPVGSLPRGAAGIGRGPNAAEPNRLSAMIPTPF